MMKAIALLADLWRTALFLMTRPRSTADPDRQFPEGEAAQPGSVVTAAAERNAGPGDEPFVAKLRDEILTPLRRKGRLPGRAGRVPIEVAIPLYKYNERHPLLRLCADGMAALRAGYRDTEYYRHKRATVGAWGALRLVVRGYHLYRQLLRRGNRFDLGRPETLPAVFVSDRLHVRIDGAHRTSTMRFLGYLDLPAWVLTPKDVLSVPNLPPDIRAFVEKLKEPQQGITTFQELSPPISRGEIEERIAPYDWYQTMEFVPGLRTYTQKHYFLGRFRYLLKLHYEEPKDQGVRAALTGMSNRTVLDIGCNTGLYTVTASERGAGQALGIDLNPNWIRQAALVYDIFHRLGRVHRPVEFRLLNINENLHLLDNVDVLMANAVLYHLGPLDALKDRIRKSRIQKIIVQCNVIRAKRIGQKNKPGAVGYEPGEKTWGNIVGTIPGARRFIEDCGFEVVSLINPKRQHPVLVGIRRK